MNSLQFSLALDPVYEEYDLYDRVKIAAEQGFNGAEFWDICSFDPVKMRKVCADSGIAAVNANTVDCWKSNMGRPWNSIKESLDVSFKLAKELGLLNLLVLAGEVTSKDKCQEMIIIENLKRTAEMAERSGVHVNIEALNSLVTHKGHFLDSSGLMLEIVKCVNSPWVGGVYDIYHMQIMEGNIIAAMTSNIGLIGHVHTVGVPGRHEHFLGETDYPQRFKGCSQGGLR
jgi:hydroxypyruvate isomerase